MKGGKDNVKQDQLFHIATKRRQATRPYYFYLFILVSCALHRTLPAVLLLLSPPLKFHLMRHTSVATRMGATKVPRDTYEEVFSLDIVDYSIFFTTRMARHLRHPNASCFRDVDELDDVLLSLLFRRHVPHLTHQRVGGHDQSDTGRYK